MNINLKINRNEIKGFQSENRNVIINNKFKNKL